jgi:hypothetical protein
VAGGAKGAIKIVRIVNAINAGLFLFTVINQH